VNNWNTDHDELFCAGYDAFSNGVDRADNPHENPYEFRIWNDGWDAAAMQASEKG